MNWFLWINRGVSKTGSQCTNLTKVSAILLAVKCLPTADKEESVRLIVGVAFEANRHGMTSIHET